MLALMEQHVSSDGTISDSSYSTIGHVSSDGTVSDSSYSTRGYASDIIKEYAAICFFFFFFNDLNDNSNSDYNHNNYNYHYNHNNNNDNNHRNSLDPDDFHITDSDSNRAARLTEAAVGVLTSQRVNMSYCNSAQDTKNSVSANDLKNILESISRTVIGF